eukprot:m.166216 g.166216  ORF g.166216 m.166216 type:complete len:291 (+) comp15273_c0_seq3:389-1261(+)
MDVAVKLINLSRVLHENEVARDWHDEAWIQKELAHTNIVTCYECFLHQKEENVTGCIVMEWCSGGTLDDNPNYTVAEAYDITRQLASALQFMHSRGVYHGDVKQENVLMVPKPGGERDIVKLSDFGSAARFRFLDEYVSNQAASGTLSYAPPERFQYEAEKASSLQLGLGTRPKYNFGPPVDCWGLGCLLWELLVGCNLPLGSDESIGYQTYQCMKSGTRLQTMQAFEACMRPFLTLLDEKLEDTKTEKVCVEDEGLAMKTVTKRLRAVVLSLMAPHANERVLIAAVNLI